MEIANTTLRKLGVAELVGVARKGNPEAQGRGMGFPVEPRLFGYLVTLFTQTPAEVAPNFRFPKPKIGSAPYRLEAAREAVFQAWREAAWAALCAY